MILDFTIIAILAYMFILLERQTTCNTGWPRSGFFTVDLFRQHRVYAPFKYRPLVFWGAMLFGITSRKAKALICWSERYAWNIYLVNSEGLERYYVYKYLLLLFASISFYFYLVAVSMPALLGVLILHGLIALTFIYDCLDYLSEIGLYALFMIAIVTDSHWAFLYVLAMLGCLNRESAVFMIPIALWYSSPIGAIATTVGCAIGFVWPRIMYKGIVDGYDSAYASGFKFLTFNPIRNWKYSILPHLKERFKGMTSEFYLELSNPIKAPVIQGTVLEWSKRWNDNPPKPIKMVPLLEGGRKIVTYTKEMFLNRIFLGIASIVLYFVIIIGGWSSVPSSMHGLAIIFSLFVVMISVPSDIREIRVYCPTFIVIIPYLLSL